MYKNRFLEIDDLRFISKFIPALGEAVKTTLDSLVSSDNIAETVNRKIKLSEGNFVRISCKLEIVLVISLQENIN